MADDEPKKVSKGVPNVKFSGSQKKPGFSDEDHSGFKIITGKPRPKSDD